MEDLAIKPCLDLLDYPAVINHDCCKPPSFLCGVVCVCVCTRVRVLLSFFLVLVPNPSLKSQRVPNIICWIDVPIFLHRNVVVSVNLIE